MTQPAESTVTLPAVGKVRRRWVIVGAAAVAVLVGYAYLARARGKSGQPGYDPATGTPGDAGGAYVNPDPNGPPGPGGGENPDVITTNAQWGTQAITALAGAGWDPQFAAVAIGLYLDSQPLDELQWQAVRAARGLVGPPPVDLPLIRKPNAPATGGTTTPPPAPKPGAAPRRYMIKPGAKTVHGTDRVWIDPDLPGQYSGQTLEIPYVKAETAPRRYRLVNGKHVWLDPANAGGRYNGDTLRVS